MFCVCVCLEVGGATCSDITGKKHMLREQREICGRKREEQTEGYRRTQVCTLPVILLAIKSWNVR